MKYYLIAGEASGDLHGAKLITELKKLDPEADIRCWGGVKMQQAGGTLVTHYKETAIMGFIEVVLNLRKILGFLDLCKRDITAFNPDVVIFIDYPGLNLKIAEWCKIRYYKTIYYITPSVWAWNKSRVHKLNRYVDLSIPILPFEKAFLDQYDVHNVYEGHPLIDIVPQPPLRDLSIKHLVLMPGSRIQEINKNLPPMLRAADQLSDYSISLVGLSAIDVRLYIDLINQYTRRKVDIVNDAPYAALSKASLAFVGSGTATLETALLRVPQIVCYIGSPISVWLAKRLLTIKHISLPNLIMGKTIVTELIQEDCNPDRLVATARTIEQDVEQIDRDYLDMKAKLGKPGVVSRLAQHIYQSMNS
jgi:lipid-A-disaccharide synthase